MPTAGVTSTFAITGRLSAESFYFTMTGKIAMTLNQDAIAEFRGLAVESWTISAGHHVPKFNANFISAIFDFLLAHKK